MSSQFVLPPGFKPLPDDFKPIEDTVATGLPPGFKALPQDFKPVAEPVHGMEKLGPQPGVPRPPIPFGLSNVPMTDAQRAALPFIEGKPVQDVAPFMRDTGAAADVEPMAYPVIEGVQQIGAGAKKVLTAGPTSTKPANLRQMASGAKDVITGAFQAASPLVGPGLADAPLGTILTLAAATAADKSVDAGLRAIGVPQEYAGLGGAVAAVLAGGSVGRKALAVMWRAAGSPEIKVGGKFETPKEFRDMTDEELVAHANKIDAEQPKNFRWQKEQIVQEVVRRKAEMGMEAPEPGPQDVVPTKPPPLPADFKPVEPVPEQAPPVLPQQQSPQPASVPPTEVAAAPAPEPINAQPTPTSPVPAPEPVAGTPAGPVGQPPATPEAQPAPAVPPAQAGEPSAVVPAPVEQVPPPPSPESEVIQSPSRAEAAVGTGQSGAPPQVAPPKSPEAAAEAHSYASTQVNLEPKIAQQVQSFGSTIPDAVVLHREPTSHATILYGITSSNAAAVTKVLQGEGPITAKIKALSIFPNTDTEYGKADVLKFDVDSDDIRRLNAKLAKAIPNEQSRPGFKPHITVSYLAPGEGRKYAGQPVKGISGQTVTFDSITFSGKDGKQVEIPLKGKPATPVEKPSTQVEAAPGKQAAAKKPSIIERAKAERARIKDFYTPGNVVTGYGGAQDKVLAFEENSDSGGFQVQVQELDKDGKPVGRPRWHRTPPDRSYKVISRAEAPATETKPAPPETKQPNAETSPVQTETAKQVAAGAEGAQPLQARAAEPRAGNKRIAPPPKAERPEALQARAATEHVFDRAHEGRRGERETADRTQVVKADRDLIAGAAEEVPENAQKFFSKDAEARIRKTKSSFPTNGEFPFQPVEVKSVKPRTLKSGVIVPEIEYKPIPYSYDAPIRGQKLWKGTELTVAGEKVSQQMADAIVREARAVRVKAKEARKTAEWQRSSDQQVAVRIDSQRDWYNRMRSILRRTFGSAGDLFADLLGATSAQTPVATNWQQAVEAIERATKGHYADVLPPYKEFAAAGGNPKAYTGQRALRYGDKNYNANTLAVMDALAGIWRGKPGAPKTQNYSGNLIGISDEATIDVWAARMLQRIRHEAYGDAPAVPVPAEVGVRGEVKPEGTTGQFMFGQKVFEKAARQLGMKPHELQAFEWFAEKDLWTRKGLTSAVGEGGDMAAAAAREGLERATVGIEPQDSSKPENATKMMQRVADVAKAEPSVKAITNTPARGMWSAPGGDAAGQVVWSSNFEVTFKRDSPEALDRIAAEVFRAAKEHGQDDAFVARTITDNDESAVHARPGLSVYFSAPLGEDEAWGIIEAIRTDSIGGFTLFGGPELKPGQYRGMRFIYMPEYVHDVGDVAGMDDAVVDGLVEKGKVAAIKDMGAILEKVEGDKRIGHALIEMFDVLNGSRENYDDLIDQLDRSGSEGAVPEGTREQGPWRQPVGASVKERALARTSGDNSPNETQAGRADRPSAEVEGPAPLQSRPMPGFYSALERAVTAKMPEKASAGQVAAIIANPQNGVKPDEVKWSGFSDWLQQQKGPVTKQAALDYLKQNQVQVEEVEKGKPEEHEYLVTGAFNEIFPTREQAEAYMAKMEGLGKQEPMIQRKLDQFPMRIVEQPTQKAAREATKFSQYTLPGGQRYRELLLTLPQREVTPKDVPDNWEVVAPHGPVPDSILNVTNRRSDSSQFRVFEKDTGDLLAYGDSPTNAIRQALNDTGIEPMQPSYKSSHWDEPNVLAHVRFDDRTGPGGERVLHVAEIQSDWHQQGRKQGYQLPEKDWTPADASRLEELVANEHSLDEHQRHELVALREKGRRILKKEGVPNAPFEKTWSELAFRRILRHAVEGGYDKLTWDTGSTNADRYDLSKHLDRIEYEPIDDPPNTYELAAFDKSGKEVMREDEIGIDRVEELVGKEIAQKILDDAGDPMKDRPMRDWRSLSGLDLKVGGEGMKGFYDQILPAYASKYVKKWGAKVGKSELSGKINPVADPNLFGRHDLGRMGVLLDAEDNLGFDTNKQARDAIAASPDWEHRWEVTNPELRDLLGKYRHARTHSVPVHSIDITPSMKASVMQGQPLFARKQNVALASGTGHFPQLAESPAPVGDTPTAPEIKAYWKGASAQVSEVDGQPVLYVNGSAMDILLHSMGTTGAQQNSTGTLGLAMRPAEWLNVLEEARTTAKSPRDGGYDAALVRIAEQVAEATKIDEPGAKRRVSLVVVQSGDSIEPEFVQRTLNEELDHAKQMGLPKGLRGLPHQMLESPAGKKAVDALVGQGYRRPNPSSPFYEQNRAVMTAEVGARLMRGGRHAELGLTPEEGIDLAMQYIEGLERENGAAADEIVKQVRLTLKAQKEGRYYAGTKSGAIERYQNGESAEAIGKDLGLGEATVGKWVKQAGLTRDPQVHRPISDAQRSQIEDLYRSGQSAMQVSKQTGIDTTAILRIARMAGIGRTRQETNSRSDDLREKALELYAQGLNTYEVGAILGVSRSSVGLWAEIAGTKRSTSEAQAIKVVLGRHNPAGIRIPFTGANGRARSDSLFEFARMRQLDADPDVSQIGRATDKIPYGEGKQHHYVPDLSVTYNDGRVVIEEIKPVFRLTDPVIQEKTRAAQEFYSERGVEFRIVTENTIGVDWFNSIDPAQLSLSDADKRRVVKSLATIINELKKRRTQDGTEAYQSTLRGRSADLGSQHEAGVTGAPREGAAGVAKPPQGVVPEGKAELAPEPLRASAGSVFRNLQNQLAGLFRGVPEPSIPAEVKPEWVRDIERELAEARAKVQKPPLPENSHQVYDTETGRIRAHGLTDKEAKRAAATHTEMTGTEHAHRQVDTHPAPAPEEFQHTMKGSKLAEGVARNAVAEGLTEGFANLPEYRDVIIKEQESLAERLIATDLPKAIKVAMGDAIPPGALLPESVFVAVENYAIEKGDVELLRQLAESSSLSLEATGMGQRIRMLAERRPNSPVKLMQEVSTAREKAATKRHGPKAKEKIKKEIKESVRQQNKKKEPWVSFLEDLRCR